MMYPSIRIEQEKQPPGPPTMTAAAPVLDRLSLLADATRCRLLVLLEEHELTVSELCRVLGLPQSTVSRHLKTLADEGWIASRREGTSRWYRARLEELPDEARRLWTLVREEAAALDEVARDAQRLAEVLADRRSRSQEFFSAAAPEWDRLRRELYGARSELAVLAALAEPGWTVGDLGAGTGAVAAAFAPFVSRVVAVDESPAMLAAARERLAPFAHAEVRRGRLEALPLADASLDLAVLSLVLHHLPEPAAALAEAGRVVAPGGRLLVVDTAPHEREELRREMGHVWLGFEAEPMRRWLEEAGFEAVAVRGVPAEPDAQGPPLFAASARRSAAATEERLRAVPLHPVEQEDPEAEAIVRS